MAPSHCGCEERTARSPAPVITSTPSMLYVSARAVRGHRTVRITPAVSPPANTTGMTRGKLPGRLRHTVDRTDSADADQSTVGNVHVAPPASSAHAARHEP